MYNLVKFSKMTNKAEKKIQKYVEKVDFCPNLYEVMDTIDISKIYANDE